jgi:uncharacterized caspase-like protein
MPQDTTVVFFAGHGVLWGDQYHFVTHDYTGRLGEDCLIGSTGLVAASTRIRALSQVFILDSCHAGGVDYVIGGLYDARMAVMAKRLGLHLFGACASYQSALDGYQGNGLFTHFLLEGLGKTDQADRDGDRTVSVVELGRYTRRETEAASRRLGPRQSPSILHFGRDIPLSHRP